jgi:hypothetical protein
VKTRVLAAMGSCAVAVLSLTVFLAPAADAATGKVITSGVNLDARSGPGNSFGVIGKLAPGTAVSFSCYTSGDAVTGPYGTETTWDRLNSGGFVPDAWIYTGSNSPTVPQCSALPAVTSFTVRGSHPVVNNGSQDTHASTPDATCSGSTLTRDEALGSAVAAGFGVVGLPESQSLLLHFLGGSGKEVDFATGTPISADALASTEFKNMNSGVQTELLKLLRDGVTAVQLSSTVVSPPNFETAGTGELYWGFGGTQGLSITGSGSLESGRYVGTLNYIIWDSYGFTENDTFHGIGTAMRYLQTVCGAPQNRFGAHWFLDSISVRVPFDQPAK